MTGPGIILSILTFILMVPSLLAQAIYFASAGSFAVDTSLISAADTAGYILILIRIIILLFSDYIYMRWSVSKILSLREQYKDSTEEEYYEILERRGNPKLVFILTGIGIFFVLINILSLFVTGMSIF